MANFNFNKVILGGRLAADPELQTTPSGISVTRIHLAVNRRQVGEDGKNTADFFDVVAWRQTAEFVTRFFQKGSSICVEGRILTKSWVDSAGIKRYGFEVEAEQVTFVDKKGEMTVTAEPAAGAAVPVAPQFEELADGEELPF